MLLLCQKRRHDVIFSDEMLSHYVTFTNVTIISHMVPLMMGDEGMSFYFLFFLSLGLKVIVFSSIIYLFIYLFIRAEKLWLLWY